MSKGSTEVKSKLFAIKIVNLYKDLTNNKKEFVMSKQLLRSGTSIGANVKEAVYAQSKLDFLSKMSIALKEASETEYWLELLKDTEYIDESTFNDIYSLNVELIKLLTSITKTSKENKL